MIYYNDSDEFVCNWLKNLIHAGLLPKGDVDCRSISQVKASEVSGYTQRHWYAGIGGWPYALKLAGWPNDRPIDTLSCPCQPFSVAGSRNGVLDKRHLWPESRRLIAELKPTVCIGEQVASADGREWLSGVRVDLEALGYEVGGADLCAACVRAPEIRQRLYWVAFSGQQPERRSDSGSSEDSSTDGSWASNQSGRSGDAGGLGGAIQSRLEGQSRNGDRGDKSGRIQASSSGSASPTGTGGYWDNFDVAYFPNRKARRIVSSSQLVVDGLSAGLALLSPATAFPQRKQILTGIGNAIVPELAAKFIRAFMEIRDAEI